MAYWVGLDQSSYSTAGLLVLGCVIVCRQVNQTGRLTHPGHPHG